MATKPPIAVVGALARKTDGVIRGADAVRAGVTRDQIAWLRPHGVIHRVLPDTYVLASVLTNDSRRLRAALLWGGDTAAALGRAAGFVYELQGVRLAGGRPEIVVTDRRCPHHASVATSTTVDPASLMVRMHRGFRVTGPEATVVRLGHLLDAEAVEIACEDARRRRLTSVPALRAYLDRFGASGRPGVASLRALLAELDPVHPANSTLEVKTRRLLVAQRIDGFVREFPLEWNGRTYRFDFAFPGRQTILETNGKRWHDDPLDYENDSEKWSVPGRHGFKVVFATWRKVTRAPTAFVGELQAALAA
jgi:hypothetical protein